MRRLETFKYTYKYFLIYIFVLWYIIFQMLRDVVHSPSLSLSSKLDSSVSFFFFKYCYHY